MDMSEILVQDVTEEIIVPFKGKEYTFKVRPLTWQADGDIMNKAMSVDVAGKRQQKKGAKVAFNVQKYNIEYMKKVIVDPIFTDAEWLRLDSKFGEVMTEYIVNQRINEEEVKN